jgi:DNA-3-methyladenine glycosylase II
MSIVNHKDIKWLLERDKIFIAIHELYGPPPGWRRPQGFTTLCQVILEQQVSLPSAKAHFNKLNAFLPDFTPEEILKLSPGEMRNCHLSKQKAGYLQALSSAILEKRLDLTILPDLPVEISREQLKGIKGIGDWTVDIYLMFCLQVKDIFPSGDIAVINAARELTGAGSKNEILEHAASWKPYRSLATYFLWHYYLSKRNRSAVL